MPKGKLPKGVQSIGEAATKRGRGGHIVKASKQLEGFHGGRSSARLASALEENPPLTRKGTRFNTRTGSVIDQHDPRVVEVEQRYDAQERLRRSDLSKSPRPSGRLAKMAKGLGKGMKVFAPISIIQGAKEWKEQGGPSARELLGIKKYKRRPKVTYGGQEM